ncbi:putative B3 domain-containing protein [Tripterygium wilfordii]|uniref:Putative B3 domain-containing protein n=1 Tax=Tripterygium wilfordii TaxID=458696 RepID=A0A7J7BZD3_TRIWF|nr:B3 domain-containing protein REM20-like [Tripterygium wilfordii]XP_038692784.1 B3 domain-containing protein REM20-like [Tripterygium wilfordii]KAF5727231.1 putative B3 domain-containing protein [Tripterygium wilfordii]
MNVCENIRSYEKFPTFFKVYLLEHSSERMKIPNAFIARIGLVLPEKVILRFPPGRTWHVKVIEVENEFFFGKGWKEFVKDNNVEHEDFLFFKYNGRNMFDFKLFGKSGTEKLERDEVEEMVIEEEEKEEVEEEDCDDESDHDYDYNEEEEEDTEEEKVEMEEEEDNEEEEAKSSRKRSKEMIGEFKAHIGLNSGAGFRENTTVKTEEIDESEPELEGYAHLRNPYFVTKVRMWNENLLLVPHDWMRKHKITLRGKVTYLGPQGRQRSGTVVEWTDGRRWINGWGDFCKANNIRLNDSCICELLPEQRGNVLRVHIVQN